MVGHSVEPYYKGYVKTCDALCSSTTNPLTGKGGWAATFVRLHEGAVEYTRALYSLRCSERCCGLHFPIAIASLVPVGVPTGTKKSPDAALTIVPRKEQTECSESHGFRCNFAWCDSVTWSLTVLFRSACNFEIKLLGTQREKKMKRSNSSLKSSIG